MAANRPAYWKETKHNALRRAPWHDYRGRCIYMVSFNKARQCPALSSVALTGERSGSVTLFEPGKIVEREIWNTPSFHPQVSIIESVVMPDHVHFLIFVKEPISKPLGAIIQAIKSVATKKIRALCGNSELTVFEPGFNDRILLKERSLDVLVNYIRANPYRLAVRRAMPDFFTRTGSLTVGGVECQAYGNAQLLECPFREQVIVHRADSDDVFAGNKARWLYTAANGGVLVSPFISKREKEVRDEAEKLGGRFIMVTNEPLAERQKPAEHDFELCREGRMLIVAPINGLAFGRSACLKMNAMAANLSTDI